MRQLGVPERTEHEHGHGLVAGDQMTEQFQAAGIGPLQIVEDEHDGLLLESLRQQSDHGSEERIPFGVGISAPRRRKVRDSGGQGRYQPSQLRPVRLDMCPELVLGTVGDVVPDGPGEELVGGGQVLLAMPEQHTGAGGEGGTGPLGHERRLSETGLTGHEHHFASLTSGDTFGALGHDFELGVAPHDDRIGASP